MEITWQVHIGKNWTPERPGSFGRTGVGAGGLETFWDELLGKNITCPKKVFFTKFGGS